MRHDGHYHLFCTLRGRGRSHAISYAAFDDLAAAGAATQVVLPNHAGYCCAPQVFYYRPQARWYLVCQAKDPHWSPEYQAACATSTDLADPAAWSPLEPMGVARPEAGKRDPYLDFWVICDERRAWLFFTSDNGKMWRTWTSFADFPRGWSRPELAFHGDVFEASHTYRLDAEDRYLTLIEAQRGDDRRYYKAYLAHHLDGKWTPLGGAEPALYAGPENVDFTAGAWSDSISHGELLRDAPDERMLARRDASFVFQGVRHADRIGRAYGDIPWELGVLLPGK